MSEALKHTPTPGPWRIGNSRLMIYGADEHPIARLYHNKQFRPARHGDAHLIAASPELLAFAEAVMRSGLLTADEYVPAGELRKLQQMGTDALNHANGDDLP